MCEEKCVSCFRSADAFRQSAMVFTEHTGLANLSVMMRYCINETECRRELIASCFEEKWSQDDCLGACDVCVKFNSSDHNVESMIKYKVSSNYCIDCETLSNYCYDVDSMYCNTV